ncbi:ubiquitin-like domain-containing CTD phosphatase 1 [Paramacrobiotus metropolitanus]|uniref:ubiquitin-like domain-containing CTD phosphatase 1 n=1 Tax=Paramacrobiotus metropolitanus TaxID=2943436 RepID=UPI002445DC8A|nr:ubiquitin-like domain-containing CTD phosphatase 1 [Paramacrobiotus metropolitanus]
MADDLSLNPSTSMSITVSEVTVTQTFADASLIPADPVGGDAGEDNSHPVMVKWSGKEITVSTLSQSATILQLKEVLFEHTNVLPHRQKLTGAGKTLSDELALGSIFKRNQRIMMIGTPEETLTSFWDNQPDSGNVVNDFEVMADPEIPYAARVEYLEKISRHVRDYRMQIMSHFREGKKLLVLDIDYTIFDNGSVGQNGQELMRPYLHEFLQVAYRNFDIIIWSATSKRWIVAKLQELGITSNARAGHYKIAALLDDAAMIQIHRPEGPCTVKALGVIWGKFPQFSETNTIIVDDLRRNFLMNPKSGIRITQYRRAFENRDKDMELVKLAEYLEAIAEETDFTKLNHRKWERIAHEYRKKLKRLEKTLFRTPSSRDGGDQGSGSST